MVHETLGNFGDSYCERRQKHKVNSVLGLSNI